MAYGMNVIIWWKLNGMSSVLRISVSNSVRVKHREQSQNEHKGTTQTIPLSSFLIHS